MTPSKVNDIIQNSGLLTQNNVRKFADFEDHSNEIETDKDTSDFRNSFVNSSLQ